MIRSTENTFDYIVVGGGSAGCVMARRLSENTAASVLLLEAGGDGKQLFIKMPAGNGFLFGNPRFDWGYRTCPQAHINDRCIYYPRGRALGGSSIMNGMIHIRGNPHDYDNWQIPGWTYQDLLPYFKKLENAPHRDTDTHGHSGPIKITQANNFGKLDQAFINASLEAGHVHNADFNVGRQLGVGIIDVTVHNGQRQSAALTYLKGGDQSSNLRVLTGALAHRIEFNNSRAIAVRYAQGAEIKTAFADKEIILSLGSFATPQLLMLSGIGPAAQLKTHDIPVHLELPGVGQNLQDHINYPMQYTCSDESLTLARYQRLDRALGVGFKYLFTRRGPGANPFWSCILFCKVHDSAQRPDLQVYFTPMIVKESPRGANKLNLNNLGSQILVRGQQAGCGFQLDINQMHPESRGTVSLKSNNPAELPIIDPQFLASQKDRLDLLKGVKLMRELVAQTAFDGLRGRELQPGGELQSDAQLLDCIRSRVTTGHHPVGTCKMGLESDTLSVVDAELRVKGMQNLRIVDGSIMPTIVTGNPNTPIIAMAEKAAEMILGKTTADESTLHTEVHDEQSLSAG